MNKQDLKKHLKKWLGKLWLEGLPGWLFSFVVFWVAIIAWILAGFGVGEFMTLVTSKDNYILALYGVSLGGTLGNKWVKKWLEVE